jgi:hypothetical protein
MANKFGILSFDPSSGECTAARSRESLFEQRALNLRASRSARKAFKALQSSLDAPGLNASARAARARV